MVAAPGPTAVTVRVSAGVVDRYGSHTYVARRRTVGEVRPAELITKSDRAGGILL